MSAVQTGAGLGSIVAIGARDAASAAVVIASGFVRTVTGLKSFFGAMSATTSPETAGGFVNVASPTSVNTGSVTATPSGGVPPYTYAWEIDDGTWTVDFPTTATTSFTSPLIDPASSAETTARCVVTDAGSIEATTNDVTVRGTNLGGNL